MAQAHTPATESETITRQRRFRLALFRCGLSLAYLGVEAFSPATAAQPVNQVLKGLFIAYSLLLLIYHARAQSQTFYVLVLFVDLVFLVLLVFGAGGGPAALAALFYVFLVLQSRVLHGALEVLVMAGAVAAIYYASRVQGAVAEPLVLTATSVLFLLIVGGLVAFLSFDRRDAVERRITAIAQQGVRASESDTVTAIEEALRELAAWFRCSKALLAFWDARSDHFCLCQHPAPEGAPSPAELDDRRDWSVFVGERLEFAANHLDRLPEDQPPQDFDLAPFVIRKFQVFNAAGCALRHEGAILGRLLLLNRVSSMRRSMLRPLQALAPAFTDLARHLLMLKAAEHAAFERERYRLAQDFHDGPLQSVISFQMRVHLIRRLLEKDPAGARSELEQLQDLAQRQVTEMRTFVNSMRPVESDSSSLTAAARRLVDDFQKESGVPVTFMSPEDPLPAPGRIGVDILQIIREALHNIHKHAQATHVLFSLEQNGDHLLISVNDNGKGFRFGGKYTLHDLEVLRLGPNSIKKRLRALGGDVLLESHPGQGANLRLKIPLG